MSDNIVAGASTVATEAVTQTKVSPELVRALKIHALEQDRLLKEVCSDAVAAFIEHRNAQSALDRPRPVAYLSSPRDGVELNLRLPAALVKKVKRVADDDHTHARRVLFTALMRYAEKYKLLGA